jgi:hypothetical protein
MEAYRVIRSKLFIKDTCKNTYRDTCKNTYKDTCKTLIRTHVRTRIRTPKWRHTALYAANSSGEGGRNLSISPAKHRQTNVI